MKIKIHQEDILSLSYCNYWKMNDSGRREEVISTVGEASPKYADLKKEEDRQMKIELIIKTIEFNIGHLLQSHDIIEISMYLSDIHYYFEKYREILISERELFIKYVFRICDVISQNENTRYNIDSPGFQRVGECIAKIILSWNDILGMENSVEIIKMDTSRDAFIAEELSLLEFQAD